MRNRRIGFTPSVLLNFWACIGFIVFPAQPAFACTCAPPESPGEDLREPRRVFSGDVSGLAERAHHCQHQSREGLERRNR